MMKAEQIPDEVVEAAAIILMGRLMVSQQDARHVWSGMYEPEKDQFRREARSSIATAINAWPGSFPWTFSGPLEGQGHVLPLPQKEPEA